MKQNQTGIGSISDSYLEELEERFEKGLRREESRKPDLPSPKHEEYIQRLSSEGLMALFHEVNELRNFKARVEVIVEHTDSLTEMNSKMCELITEFRK